MTTYEKFCREAYNLLKKNIKADNGVPSEEVEKFLKKEPHDSEFYFYCGVAASNVVNDISHKNGRRRRVYGISRRKRSGLRTRKMLFRW